MLNLATLLIKQGHKAWGQTEGPTLQCLLYNRQGETDPAAACLRTLTFNTKGKVLLCCCLSMRNGGIQSLLPTLHK